MKTKAQKILYALKSAYETSMESAEAYGAAARDESQTVRYRRVATRKRDEAAQQATVWSEAVSLAEEIVRGK